MSATNPTLLAELAERVEKATGPDRALDREIWLAVVADDNHRELVRVGRSLHGDDEANFRIDRLSEGASYTASLDAAMSLVPEGYEWGAGSSGNPDTEGPWAWCATDEQSRNMDLYYGKGATPALALVAAALRAPPTAQSGDRA